MDIIFALLFALAVGLAAFMLVDIEVNDETTIEKEIVKLTTLLPSTDKMYIIDYHEGTVIFVDNTNEVVEIPFDKLFVENIQDRDKENVLRFKYSIRKNSAGKVVEKNCEELTVYQCDKEIDD